MSTLADLRLRVQEKLDNIGSGDDVVFQPAEIDRNINEAVRYVAFFAPFDVVRSLADVVDADPVVSGVYTLPSEFFRFWYARARSREVTKIDPGEIDNILYDISRAPGLKNQYIYDYDDTTMRVLPVDIDTIEHHFFKEPTVLTGDTDVVELTLVGEDWAVEYAFGLTLISKAYAPEIATAVLKHVNLLLGINTG